jgi:hypothetical protein
MVALMEIILEKYCCKERLKVSKAKDEATERSIDLCDSILFVYELAKSYSPTAPFITPSNLGSK